MKEKVYFASDHAGFELKEKLIPFVEQLGHEVEDMGSFAFEKQDDYPVIIGRAARAVAENPHETRAIILGASGQGEAIVANRFKGVRAVVYYGPAGTGQVDAEGKLLDLISSTREHNDANILSIGARFVEEEDAQTAVRIWLQMRFPGETRHKRRIAQIDEQTN